MIYVIESKDKFHDWVPAKTLDGIVLAFIQRKLAMECLNRHRADLKPPFIGHKILQRANQKYRMVEYAGRGEKGKQ